MNSDLRSVIVFGGAFDPPHIGHLTMAQLALEQTHADQVWLMPTPAPPHKQSQTLPYEVRVDLCRALVAGHNGLQVSTFEARLQKPSYTADTVRALRRGFPQIRFSFLIGTDSLAHLPNWERADQLSADIPFLVAVRSEHPLDSTLAQTKRRLPQLVAHAIEMPVLDVSSSWLRERFALGLPLVGLVPDRVLAAWRANANIM